MITQLKKNVTNVSNFIPRDKKNNRISLILGSFLNGL